MTSTALAPRTATTAVELHPLLADRWSPRAFDRTPLADDDVTALLEAARTLDFGGVLINEVPTWRADQQPYGGLRDSGNTKEGPAWSVREMTEERLIILTG